MRSLYDELRSLTDAAELADKNGVLESAITLIQQLRQENHRLKIQKTCATAIPQATAPPPKPKIPFLKKKFLPPPHHQEQIPSPLLYSLACLAPHWARP
jgi:hypothetical protein